MVPEAGIEPARPLRKREILSLLCLPISPLGQCLSEDEFYVRHSDDLAHICIDFRYFLVYIYIAFLKAELKPLSE